MNTVVNVEGSLFFWHGLEMPVKADRFVLKQHFCDESVLYSTCIQNPPPAVTIKHQSWQSLALAFLVIVTLHNVKIQLHCKVSLIGRFNLSFFGDWQEAKP